jgi:hypothetical protein
MGNLCFESQQERQYFSLLSDVLTSLGAHPASYTMPIGGRGTPVHEVDHTHSSSAEVKKEHVCLHGVQDNLTSFYFLICFYFIAPTAI